MDSYTFRNGNTVTVEELQQFKAEGKSEEEIAARYGVSRMALFNARKKIGAEVEHRSDKGEIRVDRKEQRLRQNAYMRIYRQNRDNYPSKFNPKTGKIEYVHRMVAEGKLGRPLKKGEVVHHIDGDITNNHPDNLRVFASAKEHIQHEMETGQRKETYGRTLTFRGKTMTIKEWATCLGMNPDTLRSRIYVLLWDVEKALTEPVYRSGGITKEQKATLQKKSHTLI